MPAPLIGVGFAFLNNNQPCKRHKDSAEPAPASGPSQSAVSSPALPEPGLGELAEPRPIPSRSSVLRPH